MPGHELLHQPTALETEILQERVATLTRIANTLAAHVEEARRANDALASARPEEGPGLERRCRELGDVVRTWTWYLIVQREANGLRHHHGLAEHYGIPELVGSL